MSGNSGRVQVPVSGLRHLVTSTRRSTCQCLDSGTWQQGSLMVLGSVLFRIFQVKLLMLMFSASSVTMRCSWQCGLFEKLFFWNSIPWCNLTIVKYIALIQDSRFKIGIFDVDVDWKVFGTPVPVFVGLPCCSSSATRPVHRRARLQAWNSWSPNALAGTLHGYNLLQYLQLPWAWNTSICGSKKST